ncbi:hypothetical protein LJC25_00310 [Bacteroidales bacterium OttesenSCG-928-K03]|nr:hypothetical protein [Odoribacter sp. OttesenSCG-928-L07]MDL2239001.1 hypothetical protein [Bacteroidales bacterium OttesenSCG-928-L14]MDL2240711.1 hypothetical protein [Bacteroidales bacterium OttesenSCG-928-K22]MDL2242161.1 hypothetical protein [Bacteroidales bacterium OttesenSCG-928-K03]
MKKLLFLAVLLLVNNICAFSQSDYKIGDWRGHFSFNNLNSVAVDNKDKVYAASKYGVFSYNVSTGVIDICSKINALSDVGISCIKYNHDFDFLFIAYNNSNVDIIKNGKTINISDIYNSQIIGRKTINNIYFHDKYAYLSCGFGVIVVDIEKYEIADTYFIGENGDYLNIYDFTYWEKENLFVASSDEGIIWAKKDPNVNLAYFENWEHIDDFPTVSNTVNYIETFADLLFINVYSSVSNTDTLLYYNGNNWNHFYDNSNTIYNLDVSENKLIINYYSGSRVYDTDFNLVLNSWQYDNKVSPRPRQTIIDNTGTYWVADGSSGLVKYNYGWDGKMIIPSGPQIATTFNVVANKNKIFLLAGGFNASWVPLYRTAAYSVFESDTWKTITGSNLSGLGSYSDIVDIAIDPRNEDHFFLASYSKGLIEILDNKIVNVYNGLNSPLLAPDAMGNQAYTRIGGLKYDDNNNLWITNCVTQKTLHVLMADGNWGNIGLTPAFNNIEMSKITIDHHGQKWMKPRQPGVIFVVNDNGTPEYAGDDMSKTVTTAVGGGAIPGQSVYSIACDINGKIWIGTDKGVAVFHYPERVFTGETFDASQILVEVEGDVRPLLENETVTAICIDHGNKKWFGTSSSGVYLTSEDGKEELAHFTKENSPLISNSITNIAINSDGEVFISTDDGVCSYKGKGSEPQPDYESIYAYPNPVRPGYDGFIAVKNLKENSYVKIVDSAGRIVFSDISNGGQVVWDGLTPSGKKASSGVYIVFAVDSNGEEKASTKILIVR